MASLESLVTAVFHLLATRLVAEKADLTNLSGRWRATRLGWTTTVERDSTDDAEGDVSRRDGAVADAVAAPADIREAASLSVLCAADAVLVSADDAAIPPATQTRWNRLHQLLGDRLIFCPRGVPDGRWTSILSSRLGRKLEQHADWFADLRQIVFTARENGETLVVVPKTAAAPYVQRAAQLGDTQQFVLHCDFQTASSPRVWARRVIDAAESSPPGTVSHDFHGWCSPPLQRWGDGIFSTAQGSACCQPLQDRLLVACADQLFVLFVRAGGNVQRLVDETLESNRRNPVSVYAPIGASRLPASLEDHWKERGVRQWKQAARGKPQPLPARQTSVSHDARSRARAEPPSGLFLTHCTRRCVGPWPGQSRDDYLTDFLWNRPGADHSAFGTLKRIVAERVLRAGTRLNRAGEAVISFTAIPPEELSNYRTYRAHRGGWDFEPYGVGLRLSVMVQRGARPVIYGDDEVWECLPEECRPYFQLHQSSTRRGAKLDWSREREWRFRGDLDLRTFASDEIFLMTATEAEAAQLMEICPWTIYAGAGVARRKETIR